MTARARSCGTSARRSSTGIGRSERCFTSIAGVLVAMNGGSPDEHLVADDAERVEVAAAVDLALAGGLLGRHVRRRADRHAGRGEPRSRPFASMARAMPKSVTIGAAGVGVEQDVVGLDVAVDDAALVRVGERVGDLAQDAPRLVDVQRAALVQALARGCRRSTYAITKKTSPSCSSTV